MCRVCEFCHKFQLVTRQKDRLGLMSRKKDYKWLQLTLALVLLTLLWLAGNGPALAQDPVVEENEQCLICHSNPDLMVEFPDGSVASGLVSGEAYRTSVHGQLAMTCSGCHPNHQEYPHPEPAAESSRAFTLKLNETCFNCHPDQARGVQDSNHARARAEGNIEAAVCVDCHGAHDTVSLHEARIKIATTCRQCHSTIYDKYSQSIHGKALREEHNTDVPICVDCHGVHSMEDPRTIEFRLKSPDLCGGCHANEALMSKYNISTDVFETYVADFHGTTVTLFEKQSPDAPTNKAVCFDCHGVHDIRAVNDPKASVIKENLLETCRKCHPDATTNFPDSWMSHYQPTFDKEPLVATVNLFYAILIPGLVGFMALFVVSDIGRKVIGGGKRYHGRPLESSEETAAEDKDSASGTPPTEASTSSTDEPNTPAGSGAEAEESK